MSRALATLREGDRDMSAISRQLTARIVAPYLLCLCLPLSVEAQRTGHPPLPAEVLKQAEGAYYAPRDQSHRRACMLKAVSRGLELKPAQLAGFVDAIAVYADTTSSPRSRAEVMQRTRVRDSSLFALVATRKDSLALKRSIGTEEAWWRAGNCNGRLVSRDAPP